MPLPLLAQQGIRHVIQMHPLLRLPIPAATGGDDVQVGVVLAIAPMGLDHHNVAPLEGTAADAREDSVQARDATAHKRTQQDLGILIKRRP